MDLFVKKHRGGFASLSKPRADLTNISTNNTAQEQEQQLFYLIKMIAVGFPGTGGF